jgi:serine/threonine-protein kinase
MGAVFVGFQKSLKRQVAVKLLPKSVATTDFSRQQFRDEAETIAVLSHPYIIPIFEMGESEKLYFQVMQLVQGSDLNVLIKNRLKHPVPTKRLLPLEVTLDIIINVLDGLGYAHEEGIIHQDMKPANVLMEHRTGRPLIADFGIAKTAQLEYKAQGLIVGTPLYLSPEQAAAGDTDGRTDIYAMGVILFEMLAGVLPMRKESVKELLVRKLRMPDTLYLKRPCEASPLINVELEKVILKAVAPRREQRFQTCREFRDQLIRFRNQYVRPHTSATGVEGV